MAEAQKQAFLAPEYASNQPLGSICERFACEVWISAEERLEDRALVLLLLCHEVVRESGFRLERRPRIC